MGEDNLADLVDGQQFTEFANNEHLSADSLKFSIPVGLSGKSCQDFYRPPHTVTAA